MASHWSMEWFPSPRLLELCPFSGDIFVSLHSWLCAIPWKRVLILMMCTVVGVCHFIYNTLAPFHVQNYEPSRLKMLAWCNFCGLPSSGLMNREILRVVCMLSVTDIHSTWYNLFPMHCETEGHFNVICTSIIVLCQRLSFEVLYFTMKL